MKKRWKKKKKKEVCLYVASCMYEKTKRIGSVATKVERKGKKKQDARSKSQRR